MKYKAVYGTHDMLPDESSRWQYLEAKTRAVFAIYNYKEIRVPTFEGRRSFLPGASVRIPTSLRRRCILSWTREREVSP